MESAPLLLSSDIANVGDGSSYSVKPKGWGEGGVHGVQLVHPAICLGALWAPPVNWNSAIEEMCTTTCSHSKSNTPSVNISAQLCHTANNKTAGIEFIVWLIKNIYLANTTAVKAVSNILCSSFLRLNFTLLSLTSFFLLEEKAELFNKGTRNNDLKF